MPSFHKLRHLSHSPELLLGIVLDIERYPQFLPWCLKAKVRTRKENSLIGDLCVGYGLLNRSFSSRVRFDKGKGLVEMQADNNLFSRFESRWRITDGGKTAEGSKALVDFSIDFQLRALPLKFVFENIFCQAAERMVDAFEQRANNITSANITSASITSSVNPVLENAKVNARANDRVIG